MLDKIYTFLAAIVRGHWKKVLFLVMLYAFTQAFGAGMFAPALSFSVSAIAPAV